MPTDCGYDMGKGNISPRLGVAYRVDRHAGDPRRLRHQLRSVSARVRPRHPRQLSRRRSTCRSRRRTPSSTRAGSPTAFPPITVPDVSSGVIPIPLNIVRARARSGAEARLRDSRSTSRSRRSCGWGFAGQIGYVGTRQRDINQILDQNAGQVPGLGNAGRPLFQQLRPHRGIGPADQRRLEQLRLAAVVAAAAAVAQGVQMNVAYTWSKTFGICCDLLSDNPPAIQAMEYFDLDRSAPQHRSPAQPPGLGRRRAAVRSRQAVPLNAGGVVSRARAAAGR